MASYSTKQLTQHLRDLAAEAETISDNGDIVTKGEALARLLWKKALGYVEKDPKTGEDREVRPEAWAIQMVYERLEGRAPVSVPDDKGSLTAAEKVTELERARLNSHADAALAISIDPGPVDRSADGAPGAEGPDAEPDVAG